MKCKQAFMYGPKDLRIEEVELPELFTMTAAEYEAVHSSWVKAVKVLM